MVIEALLVHHTSNVLCHQVLGVLEADSSSSNWPCRCKTPAYTASKLLGSLTQQALCGICALGGSIQYRFAMHVWPCPFLRPYKEPYLKKRYLCAIPWPSIVRWRVVSSKEDAAIVLMCGCRSTSWKNIQCTDEGGNSAAA